MASPASVVFLAGLLLVAGGSCAHARTVSAPSSPQRGPTATPSTLQSVLEQIGARMNVRVVVDESIAAMPVAMPPRDLPVDKMLGRVIASFDAFYLLSADGNGAGRLRVIWVYPRGQAKDLRPVPASLWGSTRDLESQLQSGDPDARLRAYEALLDRQGPAGLSLLQRALADPNDDLRAGALAAAMEAGVQLPQPDLAALLSDPAPEVRLLALDAAESRPGMEALVESAAADPDAAVRSRAGELLTRIRGSTVDPATDVQQQMLR